MQSEFNTGDGQPVDGSSEDSAMQGFISIGRVLVSEAAA